MANEGMGSRDLVLPPNTYAYVLDSTKGKVSVYVGPYKNSLSNTDQLVAWDPEKKRFVETSDPRSAIQVFPMAPEGHYLVLSNPCSDANRHPGKGNSSEAIELEIGRRVNLAGPVTFPLWPGQSARTIEGHHLRHNQYLLVRVYDERQARENWGRAIIAQVPPATPANTASDQTTGATSEKPAAQETAPPDAARRDAAAPSVTMGQLMVVKGTEVSFFIPPTGIEVVPDGNVYVREAVTLERLEYCILLDENGEKRYVQGPAVVLPKPTEKFIESSAGNRKFRAIELNEHSGLYIKVITGYTEGDRTYRVGEELFIKGSELAIYFPREEHSIIEYGDKKVHHAIAIPAGEGRYVLDRNTGTVDLIIGPRMFLPDPRSQVVVRRILDPQTVRLLYPNNDEALQVNLQYQELSGRLSPGEHLSSDEARRAMSLQLMGSAGNVRRGASEEFAGDSFKRTTAYSPPRTIVLDTKYEGAVAVNIWPGYAVLVANRTGQRRVEVGPKMVLLQYDETLMPLELSTGRPKTDNRLLRSTYLRVANNQVGDIITVETKDLVKLSVEVSYRVNFEGTTPEQKLKWFEVENYVKILADHCRSRARNVAKQKGIQEFYTNTINIIRDAILGTTPADASAKRPGLSFEENGMRVYDVEVLNVTIENEDVAELLVAAQSEALTGAIKLSQAEDDAQRTAQLEELNRRTLDEQEKTAVKAAELAKNQIGRLLTERLAEANANLQVQAEENKLSTAEREADRLAAEQQIELDRKAATQQLEVLRIETEEYVKRMGAVSADMVAALQMFGDKHFVEKVVGAVGPIAMATGVTTADILGQIFKGTPFETILGALAERPLKVVGSKGAQAA